MFVSNFRNTLFVYYLVTGPLETWLESSRKLIETRTQCSIGFFELLARVTQYDAVCCLSAILVAGLGRVGFSNVDNAGILAISVPPVLKDKRNAGHANAHKDDNKNATNILNGYAV